LAKLLEAVDKYGSIFVASDHLDMSYRYALHRISLAEKRLGYKLIKRHRGGVSGGFSELTAEGKKLLVAPLIGLYGGLSKENLLPVISAKINQDLQAETRSVYRFQPVRVRRVNGGLIAEPIAGSSGVLSRFVSSNGFILIPPKKALKKDEEVKVTLFSKEEFTSFSN
jgi:molybdate transport repressor ModE-like protein